MSKSILLKMDTNISLNPSCLLYFISSFLLIFQGFFPYGRQIYSLEKKNGITPCIRFFQHYILMRQEKPLRKFFFSFVLFFKGCLELYAFFLTCFPLALYLCLGIFLFYKLYFCGYAVSTQDHFWKKASMEGVEEEVMFGRKFLLRRMTLMNDSMAWDHQRERPNGCAAKDRLIFCCFIMIFFCPFLLYRTMFRCSTTLYLLLFFLPPLLQDFSYSKEIT